MPTENFHKDPDQQLPFVSRLLYHLIDEKYTPLLDESSDFMCIIEKDGHFIYANKKLADSLGYTKKEILAMRIEDIMTANSLLRFAEKGDEILTKEKVKISDFVLRTKYKGEIVGELSLMAFHDNLGHYCGAKVVFKDKTSFLEMERLERKYESMMEDGINSLDFMILVLDSNFCVKWASSSVESHLGVNKVSLIGEDGRAFVEERLAPLVAGRDQFLRTILEAYQSRSSIDGYEFELKLDGESQPHIMEYWSYPITHGEFSGGRVDICHDITARRKSEETLDVYYNKIHMILDNAVEGVVRLRVDNTIEHVNKSFLSLLGYELREMVDRDINDFIAATDQHLLAVVKTVRKPKEISFIKKDGNTVCGLMSSMPLVFGGRPPVLLCSISDVSQIRMSMEKLRDANLLLRSLNESLLDQSLRDMLTGVYNYRYLTERLSEEIRRAKRYLRLFSLIMVDIDFFKSVNDSYGHPYGDVILREFTELLKKTVRSTDIIVRAGGEEFIIFMPDTDSLGALTLAHKMIESVAARDFGDEHRKIRLTISAGIVSYPEAGFPDSISLLDAADQAMYQSKRRGRNRVTLYSKGLSNVVPAHALDEEDDFSFENFKNRLCNLNQRNEEAILESMMRMAREVDRRIGYPSEHLDRFMNEVEVLAKSFLLPAPQVENLRRAAMLSNLGLLTVPSEVLLRSATLSDDEVALVKEHSRRSLEIIDGISFLAPVRKDILYHPERVDGRGYPDGLRGEQIPLGSKIIGLVEVYEAMISERPYRRVPFSTKEAIRALEKGVGTQFDERVVSHFLRKNGF